MKVVEYPVVLYNITLTCDPCHLEAEL